MDGTLVDSEGQTDAAIATVMAAHGVPGVVLAPNDTRGRTWGHVVTTLARMHPRAVVDAAALEAELIASWADQIAAVVEIPGAADAVRRAAAFAHVAVVSSSPRALVDRITRKLGVRELLGTIVGAEDVSAPKPAPDCWLRAAGELGVAPARCLVVEDSRAGLEAARAAGMRAYCVLHVCAEVPACTALASAGTFADYHQLGPRFFHDAFAFIDAARTSP
jgi:HAD superfamily hydrolase (TIGR01509 family)